MNFDAPRLPGVEYECKAVSEWLSDAPRQPGDHPRTDGWDTSGGALVRPKRASLEEAMARLVDRLYDLINAGRDEYAIDEDGTEAGDVLRDQLDPYLDALERLEGPGGGR